LSLPIQNHQKMLQNYLKIALRNLARNRVFTFVNVLGLGLGIAASILMLEYISFEKSVNQFHEKLPNLYRLLYQGKDGGTWETVSPAFGPRMKADLSEVKDFCRVAENVAQGIVSNTEPNPKSFRENAIVYAEGNFFELFSFKILEGNKADLKKTNNVFISKSTAYKYFENQKAIGKTLKINNQFGQQFFTVAGVYEDFPITSDFKYDMLFSLQTLANSANLNGNEGWAALDRPNSMYIKTFLLCQDDLNITTFEPKINKILKELRPDAEQNLRIQAFKNSHLGSSLSDTYVTSGSLSFVYLMGAITFLILMIAWFNYINLSTAVSSKRGKEVGVRKVVGASRSQLITQFLSESALLNLMGLGLGLLLVEILQKPFNQLIDKELSMTIFKENGLWIYGLIILIIGTLLSGAYTAFGLSSFVPSKTLKGSFSQSVKGVWLRKTLVVFQFSISIILIVATLVVLKQTSFMQNQNLGMNINQKVVILGPEVGKDSTYKNRRNIFKNDIAQQSFVKDYTGTGSVPGKWYNYGDYGIVKLNPRPGDEKKTYNIMGIDERYCHSFNLKFASGQNFTNEICSNPSGEFNQVIINEKASKELGFESPVKAINQRIIWQDKQYEILGVLKDYHHTGLRQPIDPIIFYPTKDIHYITVTLTSDNIQSKMGNLEALYKKSFPNNPFDFFFADENFNKQYKSELQFGNIFTSASMLAIFIACLGLFGLATFTAEARTKEIGIRKVLGASVTQIVQLLSKDFILLVILGIVIACPIAYYFMHKWLQDFAYRIDIEWWIFALAGMVAIVIALLTVSYQSIKAALANPVKSLRTE
jgi:putative ABC transport system permease protein